ncbi:glucose-1-phosphate cytidylyltransferase [Cellulomonas denverensis]|uniref:Glucose-1-phosphate cytidylyltransferase n=1 Tax=Cellulomonas denverensis TaxID=264297 RepID=A0A7X6KS97_9CELL|nr:glucose-1-phosphate cytidylyltransferase [Cellulomonas denverensis]NKY21243.1 glucose-1-phosphate cytidylyltransferase [Cellulomonas denverensis]GIG24536.1 glucose-1-phosphate cytidylyltransferase [Cellulomonas denverensis]
MSSIAPADIPVVILCGGMGTRLREASEKLPKPLVDIGGRPILWHIMKTYGEHGFRRFVLALGYKSDLIKQYFLDYRHLTSDFTLHLGGDEQPVFHQTSGTEDWEITFVETGLTTATAARIRRVADHLDADRFALTYGDGIGNVDITGVLAHHERHGLLGTLTGVHPSSRYGEMRVDGDTVLEFNEKPTLADGWVNGGFFVFEREFVDKYLEDDPAVMLESVPLQQLARDRQLSVFEHEGFWMGMDTFRDWTELNGLWDAGRAPWKIWED